MTISSAPVHSMHLAFPQKRGKVDLSTKSNARFECGYELVVSSPVVALHLIHQYLQQRESSCNRLPRGKLLYMSFSDVTVARCIHGALHCRRGEIELCARLLGIAAAGLNENPGLLGFVVLAKFALLSVMLPLLAFSGLAYTNGDLVPNSEFYRLHLCCTCKPCNSTMNFCQSAETGASTFLPLFCIREAPVADGHTGGE
jgi:hypothetical protein